MSTRLERSTTNRVIAGVCGGIAEYLQVDPTLVRVFFVVAAVMTAGLAFLAYLALLILMPLPGQPVPFVKSESAGGAAMAAEVDAPGPERPMRPPPDPEAGERRRAAFGYVLIALGVVFLAGNLGVLRGVRWDLVWPVVLIGLGGLLLLQRARR